MIAFHSEFKLEKKTLKINSNPEKNNISICASKSKKFKPAKEENINPNKDSTTKNKGKELNLNGNSLSNQSDWERVIQSLPFDGAAKTLVKNTLFTSLKYDELNLALDQQYSNLLTKKTQKSIEKILIEHFNITTLLIEIEQIKEQTLSQKEMLKIRQLKEQTEQQFLNDEGVKVLQEAFNVKPDTKSIKPL
jgi:hypothetical protein